ncbi:MAG: hypothetical protein ACREDW_05375 [Aestuariivirgaceae bacterium]
MTGRRGPVAGGRTLHAVEAPFKCYQIVGKRLAHGPQFCELLTNASVQLMHILRLVVHLPHQHGNLCLQLFKRHWRNLLFYCCRLTMYCATSRSLAA